MTRPLVAISFIGVAIGMGLSTSSVFLAKDAPRRAEDVSRGPFPTSPSSLE
ncbi:MAG: hypothetical protein E7L02_07085 [Cutibacterium avidum]|uniref:hypothetical protein n=1 Tax=Cutibacterium avidum TaxID=33010 RepID=UPI00291063E4|nr:hypothetical protein [Cutibacterium avidum]MDY0818663.1 hypothetical protein [Cutibacterium avidum]